MGPQGHLLANGPLYRLPENLKLRPEMRMLDIGCGRGTLIRVLDEQVRFATPPVGIDLSAEMLAMARRDEAGRRFARATATTLPFADRTFDLVTCGYVLKHLDDAELATAPARGEAGARTRRPRPVLGVRSHRQPGPRSLERPLRRPRR